MRKLASLLLAASAAGSLLAPATSAAAIGYPPPCPVQPIVQLGTGSVTVNPPCPAQGKVGPITITTGPIDG